MHDFLLGDTCQNWLLRITDDFLICVEVWRSDFDRWSWGRPCDSWFGLCGWSLVFASWSCGSLGNWLLAFPRSLVKGFSIHQEQGPSLGKDLEHFLSLFLFGYNNLIYFRFFLSDRGVIKSPLEVNMSVIGYARSQIALYNLISDICIDSIKG